MTDDSPWSVYANQGSHWRTLKRKWADACERSGKTVAQVLTTRLTAVGIAMISWANVGYSVYVALIAGGLTFAFTSARNGSGLFEKEPAFWSDATFRTIFTLIEIIVALLITHGAFKGFVFTWSGTIGQAAFAGLLSVLTSLASYPAGTEKTASLVHNVYGPT